MPTSIDLDRTRLAAWRALLGASKVLVEAIDRDLRGAGVAPLSTYDVLFALYEAPGRRLRMHELADATALSRSGLTRLVDRLEAEGVLAREPDPDDRRGTYAVLTGAGRAALRSTWPAYAAGIERHFGRHLTDRQAEALRDALEAVLAETD